jgi:hypothetical protein
MRVINKIEEEGKLVECQCGAELEYLPSDVHVGAFGSMFVTCPVCEEEMLLDEEDPMVLTVENVEWPKHFSLPHKSDFDISDKEIQEWVKQCLKLAESDIIYPNGSFVRMACGNTMVSIQKYEESYEVYVTKSYAETSIPRK